MTYHRQASPDEIERLLHHMPTVAQRAENEWAASFAASIQRQARRRGWQPSQKQLPIMRELVADLFLHGGNKGGDSCVIE